MNTSGFVYIIIYGLVKIFYNFFTDFTYLLIKQLLKNVKKEIFYINLKYYLLTFSLYLLNLKHIYH